METIKTKETIEKDLTLATIEVSIMAIKLNHKAFTKAVFNQIPEDKVGWMWKNIKETADKKKYGDEVLKAIEIQKVIAYCLEHKRGEIIKWYLIISSEGELMKCRDRAFSNVPPIYHFIKAKQVYIAV